MDTSLRLGVCPQGSSLIASAPRRISASYAPPRGGPFLRGGRSRPLDPTGPISGWPTSTPSSPPHASWGAPRFGHLAGSGCRAVSGGTPDTRSEAERFVDSIQQAAADEFAEEEEEESQLLATIPQLKQQLGTLQQQVDELTAKIDAAFNACFSSLSVEVETEAQAEAEGEGEAGKGEQAPPSLTQHSFQNLNEELFSELGRKQPKVMAALLKVKESVDPAGWQAFQSEVRTLKMQRSRVEGQAQELISAIGDAEREAASRKAKMQKSEADLAVDLSSARGAASGGRAIGAPARIVLISGFESFNVDLYKRAAEQLRLTMPNVQLKVFSDRDVLSQRDKVEAALKGADVFFGSLLFDFDQVEWLRTHVEKIPIRLVFESALELMSCTQVGTFNMAPSPTGEKKGPPPVVKKVLSMFGSKREEDKMVGYLSFLKVGPKLLKFVPGNKAADLKHWLTVYGYWNQGGLSNVVSMFTYLVQTYLPASATTAAAKPGEVIETPALGCLHPDYKGGKAYFESPADYMKWYNKEGALRGSNAPVVSVLLYRKHVITEQPYIEQMIKQMEGEGLIPLPIFINGVEAHTVVRDLITSEDEQRMLMAGKTGGISITLKRDAVKVDAIVSTIGFPLVGGPAGTMEGGRQADVAKTILSSKNVPYIVAAPLLIQDMASWMRDGIAGLQSVVLYSLPELDGAIDTVPLGGLVGDSIFLVPERVRKMAARIRRWTNLRRKPASERKVAILMYGFPPGVGATGTAALLNIPKSLEGVLARLKASGYNLGPAFDESKMDGEAMIAALKGQEEQRTISKGAAGIHAAGEGSAASAFGVFNTAAEVSGAELKEMLTYPLDWGPTEWGPIPFLPENDILVQRMENQWGELRSYRGIMSTASGKLLVPGLQAGNVFVGVQPVLGIEGDPMRLLFQRDLTPHPQYAAFYKWLQNEFQADVVLHFGMHGTVEWLPGAPLGNTGLSWSDVLLGEMPNVYVYACNNPSESIVAKRRGYGTIISHNVPPYGRAGLYKQMSTLKDLIMEYQENPENNDSLRGPIIDNLNLTGLQEDCPFDGTLPEGKEYLSAEDAAQVDSQQFLNYCGTLYTYLQVVENRLFSEGLHVLGAPPSKDQLSQYLAAYFDDKLDEREVDAVAELGTQGLAAVKAKLERMYNGPSAVRTKENVGNDETLQQAIEICNLLGRNTEELDGVLRALGGEYIMPEAGGDLLRDGAGVLPTGRNIHALDPYRMPSPAAEERGYAAAQAILDAHLVANDGQYPETVAVNLWGLDAIKTKGESVAIALYLVGARPVKEGTGRVARFELIPLEELGRPRVDVLCNMSGIFRDSFQNVVELLDDLFQRAAAADEPQEMNFIHKHARGLEAKGVDNAAARLFSNPAGDYGSMVNERIGTSSWANGDELGDTWASRNSYSYGRGGERGTARPEVLQGLLESCDRVVQEIDSVEYGLTDIQEYYANTGALKRAAQAAKGNSGRKVGCSIVETFGKDVKPKELEDVLRLEYRSKLLNPRWAEAMANQGSGGAYEISQRMTAAVGWGATTDFQEDWVWDQAADTYALDPEMAEKLRKSNPQAYSNVLRRMLEAAGRGMWNAKPEVLDQLRELYADMDDELEGVTNVIR